MTRNQYIEAVKVKLEEISPFEEPQSFIAADGDSDYANVKPIISYIEKTLDEAARNCLRSLPLTLLHADIERTSPSVAIDGNGVGMFDLLPNLTNRRFVRFRHSSALKRDISAFISSEDQMYLVMQDKDVCPKREKPVAVISSDMGQMEIYSYTEENYNTTKTDAYLLSISLNKKVGEASDFALTPAQAQAQLVQSPIEELIVLECAAMVADILSNANAAAACRKEQEAKIQAIIH